MAEQQSRAQQLVGGIAPKLAELTDEVVVRRRVGSPRAFATGPQTMTTKPVSTEPTRIETRQKRAALVAAMLGFAVVTLDAQITNVALPAIHQHLGGGLSGLQWIVTGYTLMFSALLLFGGTIADRIGSKNAYRNGMTLFVLASVFCGLAPSLPVLIAARLVQGIGAALVTPTALSLIREAFPDTQERTKAIALWAVGGSVAAAAGPLLGGVLVQVDWRLIFFINMPLGVFALAAVTKTAASPRRHARFDIPGQVAAVLSLGALTYGCIEGGSTGFAAAPVLAAFVVAVLAFVTFVAVQARSSHPMVPLALFRSRQVAITLAVALITMAGFYGTVFLQSLYFQEQRGQSALITGLLFLPMTAFVAVISYVAPRIAERVGRLFPIIAGQLAMAAGLVTLAALPTNAPVLLAALVMILVGGGGGLTVPPIASLIFDNAPSQLAGTASGVLNTFRQMGGSLGVAVFGAVVNASGHFAGGLRIDFVATALLVGLAALLSLALRGVQGVRN
jgi:MFS transporter, DHA2 family, methylenomycin A resistance protein